MPERKCHITGLGGHTQAEGSSQPSGEGSGRDMARGKERIMAEDTGEGGVWDTPENDLCLLS